MKNAARILVTGASGLFGRTLVAHLRERNCDVVAHGLRPGSGNDFSVDTTDHAATKAMLGAARPDVVVNLVAHTDVDRCEANSREAYLLNVRTVETIAAWIGDSSRCRLIQISTDQVYDGPGPHKEDAVNIVNVYGLSKYAGELVARSVGATVLRTNFFGPSKLAGRASFSDWVLARLRSGEAFTAFEDVLFSPLSMKTLAKAILKTIEAPVEGIFNLGSREGCSKAEFTFAIARHYGLDAANVRPGSQASAGLRARRAGDMRMDSTLFEKTFDFILPGIFEEIRGLDGRNAEP